ncbi:hypothetical protein LINPERHAP1_LOCUS28687 [Linum perenne]
MLQPDGAPMLSSVAEAPRSNRNLDLASFSGRTMMHQSLFIPDIVSLAGKAREEAAGSLLRREGIFINIRGWIQTQTYRSLLSPSPPVALPLTTYRTTIAVPVPGGSRGGR